MVRQLSPANGRQLPDAYMIQKMQEWARHSLAHSFRGNNSTYLP